MQLTSFTEFSKFCREVFNLPIIRISGFVHLTNIGAAETKSCKVCISLADDLRLLEKTATPSMAKTFAVSRRSFDEKEGVEFFPLSPWITRQESCQIAPLGSKINNLLHPVQLNIPLF